MAPADRHELDCLHLLEKPMVNVHLWLDGLNRVFPYQLFGEYHRAFRHNGYGVRYCLENWGPDGEKAALVHLLRDWDDTVLVKHMNLGQALEKAREAVMFFNQMEGFWVQLNPQFANWLDKGWVNQAHEEGLFGPGLSRGQVKHFVEKYPPPGHP
jgi:hypothetical protein